MHSPCAARIASRTPKLGASATPSDGTTSAPLASTSDRRRPMRSDSGPQNHAPTARAPMTTDTVRPVWTAPPRTRAELGRIACVENIAVNIAAAANRNGPIPAPAPERARVRALVARRHRAG